MNECVLNYSFTFLYLDFSISVVELVYKKTPRCWKVEHKCFFSPVNLVIPGLPLLMFALINRSQRQEG